MTPYYSNAQTTLYHGDAIAAKELGLRCVAIEAEERWCEVAAKRLAQGVLDLLDGGAA